MSNSLKQALIIRALKEEEGGPIGGAALAVLRGDVLTGYYDEVATSDEAVERDRLMAIELDAMPPETDDVALLLETLSQRLGGLGFAAAWRSIGVNPNRGRDFLTRNPRGVDWPIWKTLRDAALGVSPTDVGVTMKICHYDEKVRDFRVFEIDDLSGATSEWRTLKARPGAAVRFDEPDYPQVCEGGKRRGRTLEFRDTDNVGKIAQTFARDIGARLCKSHHEFEREKRRMMEAQGATTD